MQLKAFNSCSNKVLDFERFSDFDYTEDFLTFRLFKAIQYVIHSEIDGIHFKDGSAHLGACEKCANTVRWAEIGCPLCRCEVIATIKIL